MLERLIGHHRPEVGAADADVDDVVIALTGVALPVAAADPVGESAILSSTAWTSGTTFSPSTISIAPLRRPQRDVQHGAVLGDVDLLAAEHGVDARAQAGFLASCSRSSIVSSVMRFFE